MQDRDREGKYDAAKSNEIEYENLHSYCMGIHKHIYTYTIYITVFANGNYKYKQCINNGNKSKTKWEKSSERGGRGGQQRQYAHKVNSLSACIVEQSLPAVCAQVLSECERKKIAR